MSTAQDIVTDALREGNLLAVGGTPTTAELTEGLARLNALIKSLFGIELGEQFADWNVPDPLRTAPEAANFPQLPYPENLLASQQPLSLATDLPASVWPFPPANSRLVVGITQDATVFFPEAPNEGAQMSFVANPAMNSTLTIDANGRKIEDNATLELTSADSPRRWFYRADIATWAKLTDLALTDPSPLPDDLDDLLICALNIRLSARYGQSPRDGTVETYKYMLKLAKTRFKQAGTTIFGLQNIPPSLQSYRTGVWMF